jgi:hypothetical protein
VVATHCLCASKNGRSHSDHREREKFTLTESEGEREGGERETTDQNAMYLPKNDVAAREYTRHHISNTYYKYCVAKRALI